MVNDRALVVSHTDIQKSESRGHHPGIYNKTAKVTAIMRAQAGEEDYVPHLTKGDVQLMTLWAKTDKRHGRRNAVLIRTIFDAALRISEALEIRRCDLEDTPDGWLVHVLASSKTGVNVAAISTATVNELLAYWGDSGLPRDAKIFGITRSQAYRIVVKAYEQSGVRRPSVRADGVGAVHILRHTGALERLKLSGNPKSVQAQLRHRSVRMTLRYLKTQAQDESITIQKGVEPTW